MRAVVRAPDVRVDCPPGTAGPHVPEVVRLERSGAPNDVGTDQHPLVLAPSVRRGVTRINLNLMPIAPIQDAADRAVGAPSGDLVKSRTP